MASAAPRRPSGFAYVYDRGVGLPSRFQELWRAQQSRGMRAVARNFIYRRAMKVWGMALDPVDERFLLVGTSRSHVLLYDLRSLDEASAASFCGDFEPAHTSGTLCFDTNNPLPPESAAHAREPSTPSVRSAESNSLRGSRLFPSASSSAAAPTLQYGVASVDWYPVDGGLFISSAFDGHVKVWDSDTFETVSSFALRSRVYCARFSPVSTTHALIAAATAKGEVRLCDMDVNASVHSLLGHRDEIWTLAWSPVNEHLLATGARDGEIRIWDIRRSGSTACLLALNLEGPAVVPGRSSLHASPSSKRGLTSTLSEERSDSRHKRQRVAVNGGQNSTLRERPGGNNPLRAPGGLAGRIPARSAGRSHPQRNDPHAAASTSFASAHREGVNSLAFTPNGQFLLSSGLDRALRLWNSSTGAHQFMNYEHVENDIVARPMQMVVVQEADAQSSAIVFHPNGKHGQLNAYYAFGDTGQPLMRSTAHYEHISAVVYRRDRQELYSAGEDGLIMRWRPSPERLDPDPGDDDEAKESAGIRDGEDGSDVDTWSEDEGEVEEGERFIPPILRE